MRGNYDDVNRLCTQLAETRPWAFVNVNLRPYYAEGSKTLAYETVEQLGWELPDRVVCPIASGSLFTKLGRGFQEWLDLGLVERRASRSSTAPRREGCSPVATAFAEGWDVCKPQKPGHDRQEPRDRRPGRRPLRGRAGAPHRRRDRLGHRRRDPRRRSGCWPRPPGSSPRPPAASRSASSRKLAERGEIGAGERVVVYITGEGLKTLDATRDRFQMHEIDPDLESFESEFAPGGSRLMAVTVKIPTQLRAATGGEAEVEVEGATVGEALDAVFDAARRPARADHPGRRPAPLRQRLRLRRGHPLPARASRPQIADGDEVTILPAVAGG